MKDIVDYYQLNDALLNTGAVNSASEVQGFLCGLLCTPKPEPKAQESVGALNQAGWIERFNEFTDMAQFDSELPEQTHSLLEALNLQTATALFDEAFSFQLLLPNDEDELNRRIRELASWSQGFLHGLVSAGLDASHTLSPESSEGLKDLAQVAQVEPVDDQTEENEKYWSETAEYVKIVVLTIYNELALSSAQNNAEAEQTASDGTLH